MTNRVVGGYRELGEPNLPPLNLNNDLVINNYKFTYDNGNYIVGAMAVLDDNYDWQGQLSQYPNACKGYCKFVGGQIVEDATKKAEIEAEQAKQAEIAELKAKLQETDYIYNSIREGGRPEEYYAEVIENRKAWRRRIQELEGD